jgi:hypothetical protein
MLPLLLVCVLCSVSVAAQDKPDTPRVLERFDGTHCEETKSVLDLIAQRAGSEGSIIIIGRLGARETSRKLNRQRIELLSDYLQNTRGVPAERIVLAEAQRVGGLGRVEIYLQGRLFTVFTINRNKDLGTGCGSA